MRLRQRVFTLGWTLAALLAAVSLAAETGAGGPDRAIWHDGVETPGTIIEVPGTGAAAPDTTAAAPDATAETPDTTAAAPDLAAEVLDATIEEPGIPVKEPGAVDTLAPDQSALAVPRYEQKVKALELSGGVYDPELTETLVGLGKAYQSQGNSVDAEAAFRRALHTSRVNDGLYNPDQVPILDQLIDVNSSTSDWPDLNQNYSYLYWVSKRIYGADDPRLLPVIDRIGKWHLRVFASDVNMQPFEHLNMANDLYDHALRIIETHYGANDPRLINALYGVVLTNYQIAVQLSAAAEPDATLHEPTSPFDDRSRRLQEGARSLDELILASYIRGKTAMDRIVTIHAANAQLPPEAYALALVHLGDWFLLFNKWNSAEETYSQAYNVLMDKGLPREEIDSFFAQPRSLPAISLPESEPNPEEEQGAEEHRLTEELPYVLVSFDVSKSGRARNIRIIESNPPDSISLQRKARKSIAASKFRPRLENGELVDTTDMQLRYIFKE